MLLFPATNNHGPEIAWFLSRPFIYCTRGSIPAAYAPNLSRVQGSPPRLRLPRRPPRGSFDDDHRGARSRSEAWSRPAQRREVPPTIVDLVVAHFLRGEDLAARLACDSGYSFVQRYEALRNGIYASVDTDVALAQCVPDERLVQLSARLEPAPHRRREPEAIVFSTGRRGMAAAVPTCFARPGFRPSGSASRT